MVNGVSNMLKFIFAARWPMQALAASSSGDVVPEEARMPAAVLSATSRCRSASSARLVGRQRQEIPLFESRSTPSELDAESCYVFVRYGTEMHLGVGGDISSQNTVR